MTQSILGCMAAIIGVILIATMLLRLPDFPAGRRASIVVSALGLFVIAKYVALVSSLFDNLFAVGVGGYLTIFAFQQFKAYPRRTM